MASNAISQRNVTTSKPIDNDALLRYIGILMAIVGMGVSLYLSYVKLSDADVICATSGLIDCHSVQHSKYAAIAGIPIALLGIGAYGSILALLAFDKRISLFENFGTEFLFVITLFGFLYSIFLMYVEGFILKKWCMWCVASGLLMAGLFALASVRLWRSMNVDD